MALERDFLTAGRRTTQQIGILLVAQRDNGIEPRRSAHGPNAEDDPNASLTDRINAHNLRARWTHTIGLGFGFKTPVGGTLSIDYGWLVNPPDFLIPQANGNPAIFRPHRGQINFRFTQAF